MNNGFTREELLEGVFLEDYTGAPERARRKDYVGKYTVRLEESGLLTFTRVDRQNALYQCNSGHDPRASAGQGLNEQEQELLMKYSQREDNKTIPIYKLEVHEQVTQFLDGWYPFVIIQESEFIPEDVKEQRSIMYFERVTDLEWAREWYDRIVAEFRALKEVGFSLYDVSSNNILVNEDFTDFRIIDAASFGKHREFLYDPMRILLNQKCTVGYSHLIDQDPIAREYMRDWRAIEKVVDQLEAVMI